MQLNISPFPVYPVTRIAYLSESVASQPQKQL